MPGLSGSMPAYKAALSGIARSGASRSGWYPPTPLATIGGVRCEPKILPDSLSINDQLPSGGNTAQKSATFRLTAPIAGVATLAGQDVQLYLGSLNGGRLFGGTIVKSALVYLGPALVYTDVTVNGYWWLLNRRLVNKSYVNVSITAIVADILANFTAGFSPTYVQTGLPLVTIAFAFTTVSDAFTQLAVIAGGIWFVDDAKRVYLFTPGNDPRTQPATVTNLNTLSLSLADDIQPTRTRVYAAVGGIGTGLAAIALPGASLLAVTNAFPFGSSGQALVTTPTASGSLAQPIITRSDLLTYSGAYRNGLVAPPGAPSMTLAWATSTGSMTSGATYYYGFTFVTANGETTISPLVSIGPGSGNTVNLTLTALLPFYQTNATSGAVWPFDPCILAIKAYRTISGGPSSQLFYAFTIVAPTSSNTWTEVWGDGVADAALGQPAPLVNTAYQGQTSGHCVGSLGGTTLTVSSILLADAAGGYVLIGDSYLVPYTGVTWNGSTNSPGGTLTLTSGLPFTPPSNTPFAIVPTLTGVPASGVVGAVPVLLPSGSGLAPFVELNSATAQAALAALEGGDGIQEFYISDDSALTTALAAVIGGADLALWDGVVSTVTIETRAPQMAAGVTVNVVTGTPASRTLAGLIAHTVTIGKFGPKIWPVRTVEASTVPAAVTLEGLLTQIGKPATRVAN